MVAFVWTHSSVFVLKCLALATHDVSLLCLTSPQGEDEPYYARVIAEMCQQNGQSEAPASRCSTPTTPVLTHTQVSLSTTTTSSCSPESKTPSPSLPSGAPPFCFFGMRPNGRYVAVCLLMADAQACSDAERNSANVKRFSL